MIIAGEKVFSAKGREWTLQFDFDAIDLFERRADVSFIDAVAAIDSSPVTGAAPKLSHVVYLFQAGLHRHHKHVEPGAAMQLVAAPGAMKALGDAIRAALPDPDEAEGENAGNAERAAASTGMKRSRARSKRG